VLIVFSAAGLSACASDATRATGAGGTAFANVGPAAAPDARLQANSSNNAADYRIGPQDLLEISVFQVADLNRTVRVNGSGEISLPLIGNVHAGGRTVHQVETEVAGKLTQTYLQNPQVSVFVKEFTSQRVTLEGAVNKPGIYPLTGQTTLLQAIAMGAGVSELADLQGVLVFRVIDGRKKAAVFDLKQIRKGTAEDPQIYGDDIVVVEESGSRSMFSRIIKAIPVLGVFTFF
jgi:polysaccharide export outer membrane protein